MNFVGSVGLNKGKTLVWTRQDRLITYRIKFKRKEIDSDGGTEKEVKLKLQERRKIWTVSRKQYL